MSGCYNGSFLTLKYKLYKCWTQKANAVIKKDY